MSGLILNPYRFAGVVPGDSGYVLGGTASEYQQSGWDSAWSNDNNILAESNNAETGSLKQYEDSTYILASNFGLSVPAAATITKIHAQVNRYQDGLGGATGYLRLFNGLSTPVGTAKAASMPSSAETRSEEPDDLWGATLTSADVNASTFAVGFRAKVGAGYGATAYVYWIKVKVFWE